MMGVVDRVTRRSAPAHRAKRTEALSWSDVLATFIVCHAVGDYLLQTDWQALHKRGGLGRDPVARRALFSHTFTYWLAYVPAFIWISSSLGWTTLIVAVTV